MINFLSKKITGVLIRNNILSSSDEEIYVYGFEMIISSVIGFIIIMTAGIYFRILAESLIFYVIFVGIRPFCGGFHAKTHLKCKLTFITSYALVMLAPHAFSEMYSASHNMLILLFSVMGIIVYSPHEHENKPLDEEQKKKNRGISIFLSTAVALVSLIVSFFSIRFTIIITFSLLTVSLLLIIVSWRNYNND